MVEILSRLSGGDLTVVLLLPTVFLIIGLVLVTGIGIKGYQHYRERQIASTVVVEMLDHGMTCEEIVAVLKAMGLEEPQWRGPGGKLRQALEARGRQPAA